VITPLSPLIVIVGPTGAGKSELALHLARQLNGEIVGCDSVQVYSGVDVGSAKVSRDQREEVPHHLLDIALPNVKLTAGEYARLAREAIAGITAARRIPIVVGGTGLYLRALLEGLSPAPKRSEQFRTRLENAVARRPTVLSRYLSRFDLDSARRIHPNDRQKMTRAVELCHVSARPASALYQVPRDALVGFRTLKWGLNPARSLLYEKLNRRTEWMFSNGLLEETQILLARYGNSAIDVLRSIGYMQAVKVLGGEWSLEEAIANCKLKTRHYAKRQMTWFRSDSNIRWIDDFGSGVGAKCNALKSTCAFLGL
jgi:tRNA dimethylallyltransferase